jgi:LysM repeat protein
MKQVSRLTLMVAVMLFSLVAVFPVAAQGQPPAMQPAAAYPVIGNHTVQFNESLYCIGRAYQVSPWAIAQQNGIPWPYRIFPNQVLQIPNAPWYNIPPGPVCQQQFQPPVFPTVTPPPPTVTPGPTVVPPPPPPPPACRAYHFVRRGDTLYRIAWRYGSNVYAIAQANGIWNINLIYAGRTLCIP